MQLLIPDQCGIYIPKIFCEEYADQFQGIDPEDIETCQDPNNEWYWDSWQNILDNAYVVQDGKKYILWQDCDLFLIAEDEEMEQC